MTGPLYALGGFCARHAKIVFPLWILIVIGISLGAKATGSPTSDDTTIPGSDSTRATDLLEDKLPSQANGSVPIVIESTGGKLTSGANKTAVQKTVDDLKANQYVRSVLNPLNKQNKSSLAEHQTLGIISVNLTLGSGDLDDEAAESVFDATKPASDAGLEVSAGGYLGAQLSSPSTRLSEIVGIVAAMIVLVFVLGTVLSMVMPILTALAGVFSGLALIGVLGAALVVPSIAPTLAIMLGLGVGVDYSLFIVSRYRALFDGGMEYKEAVARAVATSGGAVLFAGSTVVISLLCLYFGGIPQVQELGYSAAIAVAVVIVASLTMLPAGLSLLGPHINALRVRKHVPEEGEIDPEHPNGWARWAQGIGRHPVIAAVVGILVLLVLAIPVTQINLGAQDNGQMPTSTTIRQSYDALTKGFGVGYNGPLLVAVDMKPPAHNDQKSLNQLNQQINQQQQKAQQQAQQQITQLTQQYTQQLVAEGVPEEEAQQQAQQEATQQVESQPPTKHQQQQQQQAQQQKKFLKSPESDPRLVKLQKKISKAPDVNAVSSATLNNAGTAAAFSAIPNSAPSAERTEALVEVLRDEVVPKALKGTQVVAYIGGTTAGNIDLAQKIGDELPLVILIIVALSYLLLTLAFRTMVVPALAAAMNLLAVAAAYGILVAIFQEGWGVELLGLDHAIPIVSFVPLMMFAILFGLSTDYTVFLLTRVSEENELHGDHRRAIVSGLGRAIRVIIAAASIMILVFSSFIISGDPTVKQFGVGLAAAVAVDAIIVTLILPALMLLVGKGTWYLPGWVQRHMPRLGIEGEEYFDRRDAEAKAKAAPSPSPSRRLQPDDHRACDHLGQMPGRDATHAATAGGDLHPAVLAGELHVHVHRDLGVRGAEELVEDRPDQARPRQVDVVEAVIDQLGRGRLAPEGEVVRTGAVAAEFEAADVQRAGLRVGDRYVDDREAVEAIEHGLARPQVEIEVLGAHLEALAVAEQQARRRHRPQRHIRGPAPFGEPVFDLALAKARDEQLAHDQTENEHSDGDPCPAKHPESLGDGWRESRSWTTFRRRAWKQHRA